MRTVAGLIGGGFISTALGFGGALVIATIVGVAGVSLPWVFGTFFLSGLWIFICSALFLGWLAENRKRQEVTTVRAEQPIVAESGVHESDRDALLLERMKQRRLERELDRELDDLLLEENRERERRSLRQGRERPRLPPRSSSE